MAISILINNGMYLDLRREYVALDYQIFDLASLETRQGTFSNDFEIPDTAHNRQALGFATVQNTQGTDLTTSTRIPAIVYQNNIMISSGFVQINDRSKEINITYFGDNVDVFALMRDKKLNEINLNHLRHTYTAANIISSFSNTTGYIYLPIDYGLFTSRAAMEIDEREIFPSIYFPEIVTGIFKSIGYKVEGTIFNRALFKKSVVNFVNTEFGLSQEFVDSKSFYVFGTAQTIGAGATVQFNFTDQIDNFPTKTYDNDLFNLTTDRYTADDDYQINITFGYDNRAFINLNGSVTRPTLIIRKNGVTVASSTSTSISEDIVVTNTDYIEAYVTNNHGSSIQLPAFFYGEVSKDIVTGSVVFPETALPDVSMVDFIKYVLFRFVGVMTTDNFSKTVYLNQFNDLKNNGVDDWSSKIDLSKKITTSYTEVVSSYAKRNLANYTIDDNDFLQTEYNGSNTLTFGSGEFTIDNDFIEGEKTIFETPFSSTLSHKSFSANEYLIPYIPRHIEEGEINLAEPRVMTVYGAVALGQLNTNPAATLDIMGTTTTTVPFAYFYKSTLGFDADDFKESLAFGVQNVFAPNDLGAVETDYLEIIRILNNPEVKKAYLKLNQIDIVNLNHLKKKYMERFGGYFYLNLIEQYDATGDSVMCELIKM